MDNPDDRKFGSGYFIRLNGGTGGANGNICYGGTKRAAGTTTPTPKFNLRTYEYNTFGQWGIADGGGFANIALFDNETADGGMRWISRSRTNSTTTIWSSRRWATSLTYRQSGTFDNPGVPTDWLEFTFFNTVSDQGTPATLATDFYIRRLEITGAATMQAGRLRQRWRRR